MLSIYQSINNLCDVWSKVDRIVCCRGFGLLVVAKSVVYLDMKFSAFFDREGDRGRQTRGRTRRGETLFFFIQRKFSSIQIACLSSNILFKKFGQGKKNFLGAFFWCLGGLKAWEKEFVLADQFPDTFRVKGLLKGSWW